MVVPMPQAVQRVSAEIEPNKKTAPLQTWDWDEKRHQLTWKFKKMPGAMEYNLRVGLLACCVAVTSRCAGSLDAQGHIHGSDPQGDWAHQL